MAWPTEFIDDCPDKQFAKVVADAIQHLLDCEGQLLLSDANERTVCAHLAGYLKPSFPEWAVDVEYNRHGLDPKKIGVGEDAELVYPDLIIHRRGIEENLLVVEVKKGESPKPDQRDIMKLEAYVSKFAYRFALFIRLSTSKPAVTSFAWVQDTPHLNALMRAT